MPDFHLITSLVSHKLDRNNYLIWSSQILPLLKSQDLLKFIDGSYPQPNQNVEIKVDNKSTSDLNLEWHWTDQLLLSWLLTTISEPIIITLVMVQKTSKELWDALHHMFESQSQDLIDQIQSIGSEASKKKQIPSKASMLVNFLPTGTLMIFDMLIAPISENGKCDMVSFIMMNILLGLCVSSCFFFQLVDSYYDGEKLHYGIVTRKGLLLFSSDFKEKYYKGEEKYSLKHTDVIHATMSVIVFAVFALSDKRVRDCLLPAHEEEIAEVMKTLPIIVSIACSGLVLIFPNTRFGVGMRG